MIVILVMQHLLGNNVLHFGFDSRLFIISVFMIKSVLRDERVFTFVLVFRSLLRFISLLRFKSDLPSSALSLALVDVVDVDLVDVVDGLDNEDKPVSPKRVNSIDFVGRFDVGESTVKSCFMLDLDEQLLREGVDLTIFLTAF